MKIIGRLYKIGLWASIGLFFLAIMAFISQAWFPIHFAKRSAIYDYHAFLGLGTPTLVFLTKLLHFVKKTDGQMPFLHFIMALFLSGFTVVFLIIVSLSAPSGWDREFRLYKHRFKDHQIELQMRIFEDERRVVKLRKFTPYFHIVSSADTTALDPYAWIKFDSHKGRD